VPIKSTGKYFYQELKAGFWGSDIGISTDIHRTLRSLRPGSLPDQARELAYINAVMKGYTKKALWGLSVGHYGGVALGMLAVSWGLGVARAGLASDFERD